MYNNNGLLVYKKGRLMYKKTGPIIVQKQGPIRLPYTQKHLKAWKQILDFCY